MRQHTAFLGFLSTVTIIIAAAGQLLGWPFKYSYLAIQASIALAILAVSVAILAEK